MRKPVGTLACILLLLWTLLLSGCAQADTARKRFEIAAQPAASGLNEFARQADIALIFSYDRLAGFQTRALTGRYTIDSGLERLLLGTGLDYRRLGEGAYFVCLKAECKQERTAPDPAKADGHR